MFATQSSFNPAREAEPGYGQLFAVMWRRRFWFLGVFIATLGVAAVYTLRQPSTYISSMQLQVEPNYQGKNQSGQTLENEFSDSGVDVDNATQISLLQSSAVLRNAMVLLQPIYPEIDPNDPGSTAGFKNSISVTQVAVGGKKGTETKIYQITYLDNDPVKTQKVLEVLQGVYLKYNQDQQKERLKKGLAFVEEQLPDIKNKVSQSEDALEKFRVGQELVDPDIQAKAKTDALYRVQQEQQANRVQLRELRSQYASLQQQLSLSPQQALVASRLSQSSRYQALLNEFQKTELALVQQRLRFNDNTDYVQALLDQQRNQRRLLQTEASRVLGNSSGSVGSERELLSSGQLGGLDLGLVDQLVKTQVNLQTAEARDRTLTTIEQQLRVELKRLPQLLTRYGRLQPDVELNRETFRQLLKAKQDIGLEIARGGFDWKPIEEPQLGAKTGPSHMRNLLLGAVVGLLLGGLAAFAREAADDAVHSSDDLKKQAHFPILGMMPELALESEDDRPLLNLPFLKSHTLTPSINQVIQWRPFRESLDLLYQNIQLLSATNPLKSLVITSALSGEGKSTLVLGLAISAARLHQRVLLIDADLRRPSLHKLLNLPNDRGLTTLLTSNASIPSHIHTQDSNLRSNISVLTAGPAPTDPAKLLSSPRMRDVMSAFEQSYDLVLLDAPPVLGMVDAILIASCCSGVVMVGRIDRVTRTELTQATTMLNQLNVIGVIANGANHSVRGDGHYERKA
ncbi:MAG: polysaccharide biosynthesis tyrosine autokinase [Leptolyngbyaceae cyanobacterium RU_5_1]|nr:polysaccharide biosynthesis tyrosine autokinase [Leptolyngbyaceae cyanobacterium RU_5_1]